MSSVHSLLPKCPQQQRSASAEAKSTNSMQLSHAGSRELTTSATTCCLPVPLAGGWAGGKTSAGLKHYDVEFLWDTGNPGSILPTVPVPLPVSDIPHY